MQEKSVFASVRMPVIYCRSDVELAQGGCTNAVLVQTQKTKCGWGRPAGVEHLRLFVPAGVT